MNPTMTELFFLSIILKLNVIFFLELINYPCCVDMPCHLSGDKFKSEFFLASAQLANSDLTDYSSNLFDACNDSTDALLMNMMQLQIHDLIWQNCLETNGHSA